MQTYSDSTLRAFAVDVAETQIRRGTRVTFVETAGIVGLKTAGDSELAVGVAEEDWNTDQDFAAPSQGLSIRLFSLPAVFKAAGAIPAATQLGKAANGRVTAGVDIDYISHSGAGSEGELLTSFKLQ